MQKRPFSKPKMISAIAILLIWLMVLPVFAAEVNFAYPKAPTKKGLYITPGMEEDALELGVRHTTINLSVSDFLPTPANRNSSYAYAFSYGGTTYYFAKHAIAQYDRELTRLAQNDVLVTAILLLPARSDLKELIYPAARGKQANYYQWNMTDPATVNTLRAIVTFFQRRYSNQNGMRIVGWIVGNEVNNSATWNWSGEIAFSTYVDLYAAACAEVYKAARSVYNNARVYLCLDHYWEASNGNYWYSGKKFLKKFASRMSSRGLGKGTWNVAYHPYNVDLNVTDIMSDSAAVTQSSDTRIITMKNLRVLTKFVREKYSEQCRVLLSEEGYSSVTSGKDVSAAQALNIALAYYIAEHDSMVDALILHRQVDHTAEVAEGGAFGLYTGRNGENAVAKKPSWETYQLADTTKKNTYTRQAAKQAKKLTGKAVKKIFTVKTVKLRNTDSLAWTKSCSGGVIGYGALDTFSKQGGTYLLTHDPDRNANVPWGIRRSGKVNCKTRQNLGFGIRVDGSSNGSCTVTLRLWSGAKRYLEAKKAIPCGSDCSLYVNLKKWKYRGKITRIDLLITPNGNTWADNAKASIYSIGIRK